MSKVILSDREISLIKGLIQHKGLNDQQVLAIFSFLDRNFNHRVVSTVRTGGNAKYRAVATASLLEINELLYHYEKIAALAEQLGFYPTSFNDAQIRKAVDIFKTAIMIYNNNTLFTRSENFIVLSIISWTYVLHCRLRLAGLNPRYVNADGSPILIDGQEKLWELSYCIERPEVELSAGEKHNLKYLIAIRNAVEHRSCDDINDSLQAKIQANCLNFLGFVTKNFGQKYNFSQDLAFAIQLQALTLNSANAVRGPSPVTKSVAAVNALIEEPMTQAEFNDPAYSFRVYVVPKVTNNARKADQAVTYSPVGSSVEVAIKLVEKPKYRMKDAIGILRESYGINISGYDFQKIWKHNDLKNPAKGLAIELGGQWFWYQEGVEKFREILTQ